MAQAFMFRLMSLVQSPPPKEPMKTETVIRILDALSGFITTKENLQLAYLFGVAKDTLHSDRRRFGQSVDYIRKNGSRTEALLICFDPNFYQQANYISLLSTLRDEYGLTREMISREPLDSILPFALFKFSFPERNIYVLFLNYAITTQHVPNPELNPFGQRNGNQINISEGTKTVSSYTDTCTYPPDGFYGKLQTLARMPNVQKLYIASAFSSHGYGILYKGTNEYKATDRVLEDRQLEHWWVSNRYFESFCEILTLMKNVSETKEVAFINLDRKFPTFQRPNVRPPVQSPETSFNIPYEVKFNARTSFVPQRFTLRRRVGGKRKRRATRRKRRV